MGIDYKVESLTERDYCESLGADAYPKYAWRNIDWRSVFDFLHINLDLLYDSAVNYWSECQVVDIHIHLMALKNKDAALLWNEIRVLQAEKLYEDALQLLIFFDDYVAHNARIYVF